MSLSIKSLLRTQRRLWGLTQKELAKLLGIGERAHVSKLEHGSRHPNIKTAIGTHVLFGIEIRSLFPRLWHEVEEEVMRRIYAFSKIVEHGTSRKSKRKVALVEEALTRAKERGSKEGMKVSKKHL
jgi:transcriptional regulator with XRE-family HTH domain